MPVTDPLPSCTHPLQVAQFFTDKELQLDRLPYQINRLLPHDIRVQEAYRTAPDFNVSFSSCGKTYHYWVDTGKYPDAIHQRYR
jgi:tRNA U38,U39,U40 pseudouridine synthase TruA